MKIFTQKDYEEVRSWVERNGRQIELALWQYQFEHGSADTVLHALSVYQNEDGGFGNALEADNWNPESTPYTTSYAIKMLDEIGFEEVSHPVMSGILRYLDSGMHSHDRGWLFNIPSNNEHPHAPWWTYSPEDNEVESVGVTLELVSFILKYADRDSRLYKKAFAITEKTLKGLSNIENYGEMGEGGLLLLKDTIVNLHLERSFDIKLLSDAVKKAVNQAIERDTEKWIYHCKKPSAFIHSPESEFYSDNEEIMNRELDWTIENRCKNEVWGIDWSWYDNTEKYAKAFAISENWWKAAIAREKIKMLKRFGRME